MRKIKLLFYSCLLGMSALPIQAKVITQQQAQALAAKYVSVGNSSKQQTFSAARMSGQQNAPSFYAFNDSQGKGFVLIAGDDCVSPVLGYSPSGQIDTDNLPPALQAWLQDVSTYISSHRSAGNGTAATAQDAEQGGTTAPTVVVAPLIKTKWYQMAPYNDMTPTIGGEHCLTGCVATAMAQVMKYYQWPKRGTNSVKYDTPKYDQKTCDVDFSQSTYDWDNMLDVYGTYSDPDNFTCSDANRQAVAKLMSDAGAAVHMMYGTNESGANSPEVVSALTYYLGYDAQYYHKNDYTMKQWLGLLKENFNNGCPLVYCGDTKFDFFNPFVTSHCFVVDGYDSNNYIHVNWGWAGEADGYYSFYEFGVNEKKRYSENMDFIKMTPNTTGAIEWDAANPLRIQTAHSKVWVNGKVLANGDMGTSDVDKLDANLDIMLLAVVWNLYKGDVALGYTSENGEFASLVSQKDVELPDDGKNLGFTQGLVRFHIGSDEVKNLADGSYQLTVRSKRTPSGMSVNGAPVVPGINDANYNLMLVKQNGKVSLGFVQKTNANLTAKSTLLLDKDEYDITDIAKAKIKIANETDIDCNYIPRLIVTNTNGTSYYKLESEPIILYGGDSLMLSVDIPICSKVGFLEGINKVELGQQNQNGKIVAVKGMEPITVKVNHNGDKIPLVEAENLELLADDEPITDFDNIQFDYNANIWFGTDIICHVNTIPEYCQMNVELTFKMDDGTTINTDAQCDIKNVTEIYGVGMNGQPYFSDYIGHTGTISLEYTPMFDTKPHYVQYNGKDFCYKFKVVDTTTGINDVTNPQKAPEWIRYDVMGRRINAPVKGLNIIKMSDGTVRKTIEK